MLFGPLFFCSNFSSLSGQFFLLFLFFFASKSEVFSQLNFLWSCPSLFLLSRCKPNRPASHYEEESAVTFNVFMYMHVWHRAVSRESSAPCVTQRWFENKYIGNTLNLHGHGIARIANEHRFTMSSFLWFDSNFTLGGFPDSRSTWHGSWRVLAWAHRCWLEFCFSIFVWYLIRMPMFTLSCFQLVKSGFQAETAKRHVPWWGQRSNFPCRSGTLAGSLESRPNSSSSRHERVPKLQSLEGQRESTTIRLALFPFIAFWCLLYPFPKSYLKSCW